MLENQGKDSDVFCLLPTKIAANTEEATAGLSDFGSSAIFRQISLTVSWFCPVCGDYHHGAGGCISNITGASEVSLKMEAKR